MAEPAKKITHKDICYKCSPDPQVQEPNKCLCKETYYIRADIADALALELKSSMKTFYTITHGRPFPYAGTEMEKSAIAALAAYEETKNG